MTTYNRNIDREVMFMVRSVIASGGALEYTENEPAPAVGDVLTFNNELSIRVVREEQMKVPSKEPMRYEWLTFVYGEILKDIQLVVPTVKPIERGDFVAAEFDVRKILLGVVPGPDGDGVEVYARNIGDVQAALSKLSDEVEKQKGVPSGWLPADGREIPRSEYPGLYGVLDTALKTPVAEALRNLLIAIRSDHPDAAEQVASAESEALTALQLYELRTAEVHPGEPAAVTEFEPAKTTFCITVANGANNVSQSLFHLFLDCYSPGLRAVLAERQRQVRVEGFKPEGDNEYTDGELATVAGYYAMACGRNGHPDKPEHLPAYWPLSWDREWWKPSTDKKRNLHKAGALILAELERLERLEAGK